MNLFFFIREDFVSLFVIHVWHPRSPLNGMKRYLSCFTRLEIMHVSVFVAFVDFNSEKVELRAKPCRMKGGMMR